ncbi:MAG: hypothetical protein ABFD83_02875 [Armatimonadota bacterium]
MKLILKAGVSGIYSRYLAASHDLPVYRINTTYFVFGALAAGFTVFTAGFTAFFVVFAEGFTAFGAGLAAGFMAFAVGFAGFIAFFAGLTLQTGFTALAVAAGFTHFVATAALAGTAFFGATFFTAANVGSSDILNKAIAEMQTIILFIFASSM